MVRATQRGGADRRRFIAGVAAAATVALAPPAVHAKASRPRLAERLVAADDPATIPPPPPLPPMREVAVPVRDGSLRCFDAGGKGEPIVLLHATTGTAASWAYQVGAFAAAGYRVVTYSRRGAAGSETSVPPDNTLETQDLRRVLEALQVDRCHLVGTASGAFIAARFAVADPHRLETLTISCSLVGLNEPEYVARIDRLVSPAFTALPPELKELAPSYRAANPEGVRRWLEVEAQSRSAAMKSTGALAKAMSAGVRGADGPRFADLRALPMPVHLIYGDADLYAPPALARVLAEHLPRGRLTVLAETGHSAHWEQPRVFNREFLRFLARRG